MAEEQRGWRKWAYKGAAKGLAISDYVGARANKVGAAMGTESEGKAVITYATSIIHHYRRSAYRLLNLNHEILTTSSLSLC